MEPGGSSIIIALIVLVILSAFFSSTETAYSAVSITKLKTLAKTDRRAEKALALAENYDKLLSAILIGNNIVNITASSLATVEFVFFFGNIGVTIATVVMTIVILIFGEITPKSIAKENAEKLALAFAGVASFLVKILTPLSFIFMGIRKLLMKLIPESEDKGMPEEELLTIVDEAEQEGELDAHEGELIRSAIEFYDQDVEDILTHRVDMSALDVESTMDEAEQMFRETGYSRLPVYEETIDKIIGVIHEKDFYNNRNAASIRELMHPPLFVPTSSKISDLLRTLQQAKNHMAIVADEYGGTMGLVTLEDIVEELVGEIYDEHDEVIEEFAKQPDGSWIIQGSAEIERFQELFSLTEEIEAATVGGWVLDLLERFPDVGDTFTSGDLSVTVTKVETARVVEIQVKQLQAGEEKQAENELA